MRWLVDFSETCSWAFLCPGRFLITDSVSFLVRGLFRFSVTMWVSVGTLCVSRNFCAFDLIYLICWHIVVHSILIILFISVRLVVISSVSFLILVILVFFFLIQVKIICQFAVFARTNFWFHWLFFKFIETCFLT